MEERNAICPTIQSAFELLGRKWATLVVYALSEGERHFCDLQRALPDLSDRMLVQRLKELEEAGVVARKVHPGTPVRVAYSLTDKGAALKPVLAGVADWAGKFPTP